MTNPSVYLSLLLPAYNEGANLENTIRKSVQAVRALNISFEIVAVNDGSVDNTAEVLADLAQKFPELKVCHHNKNRGLGAAIRTATTDARGEFCIVLPADNPFTAETLKPFLQAAPQSDLVLGFRSSKPGYTWLMRFNSWVFHTLLRWGCGLPYRDVNWIHLYRREIFEDINMEFDCLVMHAEIVLKAHALGLRITEVSCPMQMRQFGRASASRFSVMIRTGANLLKLLFVWRRGQALRKKSVLDGVQR